MAPTTGEPPADPTIQKSLGLSALVQQLQPDHKYTILDLGPAIGANLKFWSQFPCKIHLEDFSSILKSESFVERENDEDEEAVGRSFFKGLLPFSPDARFDIILCWDFFNYMNLAMVTRLVQYLTDFCTPGTLLFALLSSAQKMPAEPTVYRIIDQEHLQYLAQTGSLIVSPRYNPRDINRMMAGFQVSSSFLLRNGIQEYLFFYRD